MAFSQPQFPEFVRGDKISADTLNKLTGSVQSSSINIPGGGGIDSHSSTSGTVFSMNGSISRPPIWAQIVSIKRKSNPNSGSTSGAGIGGTSTCPSYVYAYGWVELVEDIDVDRSKQEFFRINPYTNISGAAPSGSGASMINDSSTRDQTTLECRDISKEGVSVGGTTGTPEQNPAFEVNNQVTSLGTVVKLYYGSGQYMLFNNTGSSASGTSSNFIDVITNVCPIFEEVEPSIGVTLINTTGGIKGGPITSSGTIQLSASGVKTGTYNNPTVVIDTYGRITQAANGDLILDRVATLEAAVSSIASNFDSQLSSLEARITALEGL